MVLHLCRLAHGVTHRQELRKRIEALEADDSSDGTSMSDDDDEPTTTKIHIPFKTSNLQSCVFEKA